jgi:hypothetical protein
MLKRRAAHVEREMQAICGSLQEMEDFREIFLNGGQVRDERGLGESSGEIRFQICAIVAHRNGANALRAARNQYETERAF